MSKFSIDYDFLSDKVEKRRYKLADVKDKIVRLGFDVVRFREGNPEKLWQIQSNDDGDYIIALYEDDQGLAKEASKTPWSTYFSKTSSDLHILYNGESVGKLDPQSLGFEESDLPEVPGFFQRKLASDASFVKKVLSAFTVTERAEFLRKHPELE